MKPIERVALTLQHKEADRVPVYPLLNGISRKLVGAAYQDWAKNADICADAYSKVTEKYDLDVICTLTDLSVEAADFGQTVLFPENEAAHPDMNNRKIKTLEDLYRIEPLNVRKAPRMSEHVKLCDKLIRAKGKEVPVVAFVFGPLGILSMMRGQAELFMDIIDAPEAVMQAQEAITQTLLDYVDRLMETGVHAIMLDTLFASQSIMSKQMWLETEGPFVERMAKHIHEKGCMVMIHNCGNGIYFDVQIQTMKPEAISFLHTPDDCCSYEETKEKYGKQTTLIGCISPTWIATATPEEVEVESKRHIDIFKKDGGFILATGCEYPANATFENAEVMVRAAKKYGRYESA